MPDHPRAVLSRPRTAAGIGLLLAGVVLLLDALAVVDLWATGGGWWPVLLVIAGVVLVLRRSPEGRTARTGSAMAVLTARTVQVIDRPYRGGRISVLLGHADLDLRQAAIEAHGARVTVRALLGNASVTVPPGWAVQVTPRLLLAGLDTDVLPAGDGAPVLSVRGTAVLSDVHVRTGPVVA